MKSPVCFSRRAKADACGKVAGLALAAVLTAGGAGRAQATAPDAAPPASTPPAAMAPAANASPAPAATASPTPAATASPTPAAPSANAPVVAAPAVAQASARNYGPQKPAANAAMRAALGRAASQPMSEEQRAIFRAVDAFYAERGDAPVYFSADGWTVQARGAFEQLRKAGDDGLDLRAWRVYSLDAAPTPALAAGEVALAQAVAAYAFQASGGRIEPARIGKLIGLRPEVVSAARALEETSQAADAGARLAGYNPPQPGYRALREKLAELRANPARPLLAETEHRRRASDARSVAAVAARRATEEADLRVNMEFWRWMPRDLGADRIMVNIPEFVARLYRNDQLVDTHRIVVGKPRTPTPMFSDKMEYLVVNPSWYVPQSIIKKDMGGRTPNGFDGVWKDGILHVRQPPGEKNALGRIKFIFPNAYAVYMHDTPARSLFAHSMRAYSHGCMRVDQPLQWAVDILGADHGWTAKRIERMYGKNERRVNLPAPLPIHIGYFTERVDESGELRAFPDIYGYAAGVRKGLGLGG